MFEIGDTLREARLRQGLTIKDVEDTLKIRGKYLQALEQDDFEVLPGPTFVKAFLRTYASFLGLEADVLVAEYSGANDTPSDAHRVQQSPPPSPRTRARRSQPNYVVVAVVALIVIAVLAILFGDRGQEPAVIDPENVAASSTSESGSTSTSAATGETPQDGVSAVTVTSGVDAAALGDPDPDRLDLVIEVVQNRCWLVIREESAAGRTLYSGTLDDGDQLLYSAEGRLWLRVGDPAAIRMFVDGAGVAVPEPYGDFVLSESGLQRAE
jgi:transcriptional regulator with XRE-family HTH domain